MITKENILFCLVGLFAGLLVGFMFANSVNQGQQTTAATTSAASSMPGAGNMPAGHPPTGANGGSSEEVQAAIEKARGEPDNFEAQIKAAEMFYQIQRFEGAIEFLKQAAKIKPDDYTTLVNLGNAYFDSSKFDEAEKTYAEALVKKPDDVDVRTDLGLSFAFRPQPDYERAIKEFETVLAKDPKHTLALQNLVVAHTKKGDAAGANAALARLEAADAKNSAIAKLREDISKIGAK